jgi:hypothetical protein
VFRSSNGAGGIRTPGPDCSGLLLSRQPHSARLCHRSDPVAVLQCHRSSTSETRLDQVFASVAIEDEEPVIRACQRALDDVSVRVRMDSPKVNLTSRTTNEFALDSYKCGSIVNDEVVRRRLCQRNRDVVSQLRKRRNRPGRRDVAFPLREPHASMVPVWATGGPHRTVRSLRSEEAWKSPDRTGRLVPRYRRECCGIC